MSRDERFDALARDTAQGLSRRQVFGRLLGGMGLALLSAVGLSSKGDKECGKLCQECCHNAFPDHGREYGQCISDCQHGQGICGPIVCPEG